MPIRIRRQFWLGGRIYLADKIETNPNASLVEFTNKEMAKPYNERLSTFEQHVEDGPTTPVEEQSLSNEKEVKVEKVDEVEEAVKEEVPTSEEEEKEVVVDGEDEYEFITVEEFKALKVTAQIEYVKEIEDADVDEDVLYEKLEAYLAVAKSKSKEAIQEILDSYED